MNALVGDVKLFVVLLVLSVPAYILIWRTFFGDWDDVALRNSLPGLAHWLSSLV